MDRIMTWRRAVLAMALAVTLVAGTAASAAEPIKLGFSVALTGGVAAIGKQVLIALQIWKDDVNAKGGLLGRPVDLVYYDDQSNPSNVPPIYTKLMEVDKVDLVIGPYATNLVVPAIPILMTHNMATVGILANAANHGFHYKRYFSILNSGPEPEKRVLRGLLRSRAPAQGGSEDDRARRRRRRVLAERHRGRAREPEEAALHHGL